MARRVRRLPSTAPLPDRRRCMGLAVYSVFESWLVEPLFALLMSAPVAETRERLPGGVRRDKGDRSPPTAAVRRRIASQQPSQLAAGVRTRSGVTQAHMTGQNTQSVSRIPPVFRPAPPPPVVHGGRAIPAARSISESAPPHLTPHAPVLQRAALTYAVHRALAPHVSHLLGLALSSNAIQEAT
jgi:hypothetical protein